MDVFLGNGRFSFQTVPTNVFFSSNCAVERFFRHLLRDDRRFLCNGHFWQFSGRQSDKRFFGFVLRGWVTSAFSVALTFVLHVNSKLRRQALLASPYFALHCLVPLSATVAIEISYDFASFTALLASLCASLWRDSSLEQFCHHVW